MENLVCRMLMKLNTRESVRDEHVDIVRIRRIGSTSTIDRSRGVTGSAPANILAIYKASSALWLRSVSSGSLLFPCQLADSPARSVCEQHSTHCVIHSLESARSSAPARRVVFRLWYFPLIVQNLARSAWYPMI